MSRKLTTDEFIQKAREVHGDKYDYSKVEYKSNKEKVCIICKEDGHGKFYQTLSSHLKGSGCPMCTVENRKYTTENFIKRAKEKHGNKYDYSKVDYKNNKEKICIICKEEGHGEFYQAPSDHIQGKGCPRCGSTIKLTKKRVH